MSHTLREARSNFTYEARKGESIDAYESGNRVNWQLVTSFVLGLKVGSYIIGLSSHSGAQNYRSDVTMDTVQISVATDTTQLPFTLDLQENQGAEEIFGLGVSVPAAASGTINATLDDQYFTSFYVLDGEGRTVATDVVAPGIKMSLEFHATNSARAEVVEVLALTVIPFAELKGLYDEIDDHPRFPDLVSIYSQAAGARDYFEMGRLSAIIAADLATPLLNLNIFCPRGLARSPDYSSYPNCSGPSQV